MLHREIIAVYHVSDMKHTILSTVKMQYFNC